MWKLLVTHNFKSEYNFDCVSVSNVEHILFECPIVETVRKEQWQKTIWSRGSEIGTLMVTDQHGRVTLIENPRAIHHVSVRSLSPSLLIDCITSFIHQVYK